MTFEEALNELRQSFDSYIKNKVLQKAELDHLGNIELIHFLLK